MRIHCRQWLKLATVLISCLLFAGCGSKQLIPDTGPNILDVYEQHMSNSASVPNMLREIQNERRDLAGYTRTAGNELTLKFPKLPNPELVMYVFPHLTAKGRPVPGYSTSFSFYEVDQYAMPGEIVPREMTRTDPANDQAIGGHVDID